MSSEALPVVPPTHSRLLVTSADPAFRGQFTSEAASPKFSVEEAMSGAHALAKMGSVSFDTLILDRKLPDLMAQEVAEMARRRFPSLEIHIIDSSAQRISVPHSKTAGASMPSASASTVAVKEEVEEIRHQAPPAARTEIAATTDPLPGMVGNGRAMQQVYQLARMVAPRDTTVLITGETGTGKELVARAIHEVSPRADKPFVVVNCAAIPEALLEAELFGHARGAFTGAVQSRVGRIHNAHGGSLFLDEIGDLPLSMQAKLLRFLQDGEVQRLGSADVFRVDVRVICATNVRLLENVKQKLFRQDLYYRVAVFPIELPPLRERREDIDQLAEKFLAHLCSEAGVQPKRLSASAFALLRQSQWPGNVRELQHAMERAFILVGRDPQLHVEHFSRTIDSAHFKEI